MSEANEEDCQLTPKMELFCKHYYMNLNATQAAIKAGYSENTAGSIGWENLKKPQIQKRIQELQDKRSKRLEISADRVLLEWARLAYGDMRQFFNEDGTIKNIHELDDDCAAMLAGMEIEDLNTMSPEGLKKKLGRVMKIKTYDKTKALEAVSKHLGIYKEDNKQKQTVFNIGDAISGFMGVPLPNTPEAKENNDSGDS